MDTMEYSCEGSITTMVEVSANVPESWIQMMATSKECQAEEKNIGHNIWDQLFTDHDPLVLHLIWFLMAHDRGKCTVLQQLHNK